MGAYCVCTWLRRRAPLDAVFDQVPNDVEKHVCTQRGLTVYMCRANYVKFLYTFEVYTSTGRKMTLEERAQFTCSKLSASVVSARDRKIQERMRHRQAGNGMAAAGAQVLATTNAMCLGEQARHQGTGLEAWMPAAAHEGTADAMRLAAEVFGQAPGSTARVFFPAHAQTADAMRLAAEVFGPSACSQAPTTSTTTMHGKARQPDSTSAGLLKLPTTSAAATIAGYSNVKAWLWAPGSTGSALGAPLASGAAATSAGCSSARAPLPVAVSRQESFPTSVVFGTGATRVQAPVTATMSASLITARVLTSAPASAGVSSAKVPDVQTPFTGMRFTTSRVLTSAPAFPVQANNTASPVHGSELTVKFRLSELAGHQRLKKKLKLQHTERTSLPYNGASFSDVLSNGHARQAVVSQPCAENTQAVLPIKREEVEDGK